MNIVEIRDFCFAYPDCSSKVLDQVNLSIQEGTLNVICGRSGCGKSTLLRHLKSVLMPHGTASGEILYKGKRLREIDHRTQSQEIGFVMQNPDNQIIGNIVEEDVGFGPENLGVPTEEIWERVDKSLKAVGMTLYRKKSPNRLSGGQKQRVAIAGVMAMKPQCIVLDEPTAMLDPNGRAEVIRTVRELNRKEGITAVLITHYMEEVIDADRVIVMDDGAIVMDGTPREVFSQVEKLKEYRLDVPQATELAYELKKAGVDLPDGILSQEEFVEAFLACCPGELLTERQTGNADGDSCGSHSSCRDTESREEQTEAAGR